ncbi:MAG: hypothetical protein IIZ92_19665 [Aquincola sp.]|nr:hypothetical protein [Aquincola sp.]
MAAPLMQQAAGKAAPAPAAGSFKRPDIGAMIPAEIKDVVERVHAAGLRIMTSPEMRQEVMNAIQSQDPTPKVLAENVTGLLLTLDQKAAEQGQPGIPPGALFPAGMELLGEAGEAMVAAGRPVSQDDFNTAAMMMYGMVGEKLGLSQDELMQGAAQSVPESGGESEDQAETMAEGGNENEPVHGGGPDMESEPVEEPPESDDEAPGQYTTPPPRRPLMGRAG